MNKFLLIAIFLLSGCDCIYAQVNVTTDVLPNTNSADSTAVLNNNLRLNQNAINSIGGYFNSNGYLTEANGGTGANLAASPNGSIFIQNANNVGIGTFAQGNTGWFLLSQGIGAKPLFSDIGQAGNAGKFFTTDGTNTSWTFPGLLLKSTTTVSSSASSSAITLTTGKAYRIIFKLNPSGNGATIDFILNADTGTSYWLSGTGSAGASSFVLSATVADTYAINGTIDIVPNQYSANDININSIGFFKSSASGNLSPIGATASGIYVGSTTVTSITFRRTDAATMSGTIWVYEYSGA